MTLPDERGARLELVESIVSAVSHDFNNVLAAVSMSAELVLLDGGLDARTEEDLEKIVSAARRGAAMTAFLGVVTDEGEEAPETLDVATELGHVAKIVGRLLPDGVSLEVLAPAESVHVSADRVRLQRALFRLTWRAAEAIGSAGGSVEISVDRGDDDVRIHVTDTRSMSGGAEAADGRTRRTLVLPAPASPGDTELAAGLPVLVVADPTLARLLGSAGVPVEEEEAAEGAADRELRAVVAPATPPVLDQVRRSRAGGGGPGWVLVGARVDAALPDDLAVDERVRLVRAPASRAVLLDAIRSVARSGP